jgi:hypothetical protein
LGLVSRGLVRRNQIEHAAKVGTEPPAVKPPGAAWIWREVRPVRA